MQFILNVMHSNHWGVEHALFRKPFNSQELIFNNTHQFNKNQLSILTRRRLLRQVFAPVSILRRTRDCHFARPFFLRYTHTHTLIDDDAELLVPPRANPHTQSPDDGFNWGGSLPLTCAAHANTCTCTTRTHTNTPVAAPKRLPTTWRAMRNRRRQPWTCACLGDDYYIVCVCVCAKGMVLRFPWKWRAWIVCRSLDRSR